MGSQPSPTSSPPSHPSRRTRALPLLLALAVALLLSLAQPAQAQTAEQQREVNHRMNDLVDSVKDAVHEAEAAAGRRQVVDLGQTLHLLESKFSGLRAALMQEMGASAGRMASQNGVSNELLDRTAKLVKSVVKQREEVRRLGSDMREVDSAVRALREGLSTFEKEVNELNQVVGDLHITHNELSSTHTEAKNRLRSVVDHQERAGTSWWHRFMYLTIFAEALGIAAFLYAKRPGRAMAHKAYGKFG